MWERSELKKQAKTCLKEYFWQAVLITLLYQVVRIGLSLLPAAIPFIGLLIPIFVLNVITVGIISYYRKREKGESETGIGELFEFFRKDVYLNIVCVQFITSLKIVLWGLLLIVPGILKALEYCMVPYLLSEYPEKDHKEIQRLSREMMTGNKGKTFLLGLSFCGWFFLGFLTCGIGLIFIIPYYQATWTELYFRLKENTYGYASDSLAGNQETGTGQGIFTGVQGALTGVNYFIEPGTWMTVGSDASRCNIVIGGAQTSPVHMQIYFDGNWFYVVDYSEAGTSIWQQGYLDRGQTVPVAPGTYLQIGGGTDIFALVCHY